MGVVGIEKTVAMGVMERRQQTARRTFGGDRKENLEKAIGWGSWLVGNCCNKKSCSRFMCCGCCVRETEIIIDLSKRVAPGLCVGCGCVPCPVLTKPRAQD